MINKQRLNTALSTIHQDESGRFFSSGRFIDLMSNLNTNIALGKNHLHDLMSATTNIHQGIWNLETIALRLDWQKGLIAKGELSKILGSQFAACDIDLFHVQYRSVFDHLGAFIGLLAGRNVPRNSFSKLRSWLPLSNNRQSIDEEWPRLIDSCDWFIDMREVRDSIVHKDGHGLVFPDNNTILFQVYTERFSRNMVHIPEVMVNENVVDFELYGGLLIGYLLAYLEEISAIANDKQVALKTLSSNGNSYHDGLPIIRAWIERVCSI